MIYYQYGLFPSYVLKMDTMSENIVQTSPNDPDYLAWLYDGNTTLSADTPHPPKATRAWVEDAIATAIADAARRRIRLDITLDTGGVATIDITPAGKPYAVAPMVDPIFTYDNSDKVGYTCQVLSVSETSLVVTGIRTRGTLLLTSGPFEQAEPGDVVSVWLIEQ